MLVSEFGDSSSMAMTKERSDVEGAEQEFSELSRT